MSSHVELALGTVQFGLAYGIAGRGKPVPRQEVREIFARACEAGIRLVDTAPAYGDIEERVHDLSSGCSFEFTSKISALPPTCSADEIALFIVESIGRSRARLGERLSVVLFHRGQDLLGHHGEIAWKTAVAATECFNIRLGASCYSPAEIAAVRARFPIKVAQVPGNALDQRLAEAVHLNGVELHLRSVFLQGLLLLEAKDAAMRLPRAAGAFLGWQAWRTEHGLTQVEAALGIAKGLPGIRYCVVGVDRLSHLEEIVAAWRRVEPLAGPGLAIPDEDIIDPRRW